MAEGDFDIKAVISAQTSQFEKGLKDCQSSVSNLTNSLGKISDIVKKAFAFTGITVGIKSITDFGKACVQSATQAEKTFSILDNTIKTTGADAWTSINELTEVSKTLSDSTNYSVTEIQRMQSVLLGFTNITGEAFEGASEAVLDMATVMGMDLTSAVQTVGKALDDPINGLDSLRRQGFHFTEEQKEQLKQLVENGNRMEAQKIILDELAVSYGGASQAGQTAFAKITHSIDDFQDTLGSELIPFVKQFFDDIAGMINDMMEEVKKIDFTPIHDVLVAIEPLIKSVFGVMLDLLKSILPPLGTIANLLQPVFSILGNAISSVSSAISWFMGTEYDAEKSTSEMNKVLSLQADKVNELTNEIRKLTVEQRNAQQASLKSAMLSQQSSIEKTKKMMEDLQKEITDLEDEYDELNNNVSAFQEVTVAGENIGEYYDPILAGIMRMNNAWEEGSDKVEEVYENQKKLAEVEDGLKEKKERYNKLTSELSLLSAEYESLQAQLKAFGDFELEEAERIERTRIEAENNAKKAKEDALNDLSKYIESYADKEIAQKIKLAQQEMDIDIQKAQIAGKSEEEIAEIRKNANDKIKGYMLQQITNEEKAENKKLEALEAVVGKTKEVEDLRTKIHDYYTHERESVELKFLEIIGNATEEQKQINYTWDIKILQLQKDSLKSEEEKKEKQKQILTLQKEQAVANASSADEVKKIEKYYDMLIDDLDKVVEKTEEIEELKKADYSWTQKLKQQELSWLQTAMDSAVERAKAEGKSEEEIAKIKEQYFTEMQNKQLELLALQKEIDLARSTSAEQAYEIDTYYTNEEIALAEETAKKIAQAYAQIPSPLASEKGGGEGSKATGKPVADTGDKTTSDEKSTELADYFKTLSDMSEEYNNKLEAQKLARIEKEKSYDLQQLKEQGASQEEIFAVNKAYTERILNMKLDALQKEKDAILQSIPDDENYAQLRADIEKYYLNEETEMRKDSYKEIEKERGKEESAWSKIWSKMMKGVSTVTGYMVSGFKTAFSAISNAFKAVGNVLSSLWSGFVKALDFNPDETLTGLLKFEDKILSFFYDVLPQIPSFLASALQSVASLLDTLFETIDFDSLFDSIADGLSNVLKKLPSIIQKAVPKLLTAMKSLAKSFIKLLPDLLKVGMELVKALLVEIPNFMATELPSLISGLYPVIMQLLDELPTILEQFVTGLTDLIINLLKDPDKLLDMVFKIIDVIIKIPAMLLENAGKIVGAFIEAIPKLLAKIFTELPRMIGEAIRNVLQGVGKFFSWVWDGIKGLFGFENGTNSAPKGLAVVGEAGPELVNFKGGEQVINNRNTQRLLSDSGKGSVTINNSFYNTADTSAYQIMRQLNQQRRELAFNGVL